MNRAKRHIYKNEIYQYLLVEILFLVAFALVIWVNVPSFHISCNYSIDVCNVINNVTTSLSLSYIAGFIFFFLSQFIPTAKRKYEEESLLVYCLNNLTKDYYELFNFGGETDNYQRLPFAEISKSLFQEDVSQYCNSVILSEENGECDKDVHFKPEALFNMELRTHRLKEDLTVIQTLSHIQPYPVVNIIGLIKSSYLLSEIEMRRCFRANFTPDDMRIRLALYKQIMKNYYELEAVLMDLTNMYNKYYPNYKIWNTSQDLNPKLCFD